MFWSFEELFAQRDLGRIAWRPALLSSNPAFTGQAFGGLSPSAALPFEELFTGQTATVDRLSVSRAHVFALLHP